jgi:hypothetical protein
VTADADTNIDLIPARHGQNERAIALTRKNALFAGHDDGAENWAILASLIETALCRARHRQVYAARRTMPNGLVFPRIRGDRHVIGSA